jgi:hypothetical protein
MPDPTSPLKRSIGWTGAFRWLLAVVAVVAIGAALAEGRWGLAVGEVVMCVVAVVGGFLVWRARQRQ